MTGLVGFLLPIVFIGVVALWVISMLLEKSDRSTRPEKTKTSVPDLNTVTYAPCKTLVTAPEQTAFQELRKSLNGRGYLCPKVRIADLIEVSSPDRRSWQIAFNQISSKHVDFAVMSRAGEILFAVEIDDSSHQRADRRKRDELVNRVFKEAQLPLVRIVPGGVARSAELAAVLLDLWPESPTVSQSNAQVDPAAIQPTSRLAPVG